MLSWGQTKMFKQTLRVNQQLWYHDETGWSPIGRSTCVWRTDYSKKIVQRLRQRGHIFGWEKLAHGLSIAEKLDPAVDYEHLAMVTHDKDVLAAKRAAVGLDVYIGASV